MLQYCFRSIASLVYHRILDKTYPTNLRYFRQISPLWRQQRAIWSQISPAYLPALWATLKQEQMSKKVRLLDLNCWIWISDLIVSSLIFLADVVTKVGIIGMLLPLAGTIHYKFTSKQGRNIFSVKNEAQGGTAVQSGEWEGGASPF